MAVPALRCSGTCPNDLVPPFGPDHGILRCLSPAGPIGLHLNYDLRLPASWTRDAVIAILADLHAFAQTLPLASWTPLLIDHGGPLDSDTRLEALRGWASIIAVPFGDDDPPLVGDPHSAQGFNVQPGRGCETATFGFMRRHDAAGAPVDWYWQCSCKTQYASTVSDAHLIACHTALVQLLDHAITLGIEVDVYDETHYWESRDSRRLIAEVHAMNRLVARVAGQLSDAMGEAQQVRAPIFEHPRFERLEMGEDDAGAP